MRVLVAEDDPGLNSVLTRGLEDAGYLVDTTARGDDAVAHLRAYEYDVAVIDWRMPGVEGIDVVRWARRHSHPAAILMLTARDTHPDRIAGLDAGADDYLVKPFDFGELLARVRALQRRPRGAVSTTLSCGDLQLEPERRDARCGGETLTLTATEFGILELLMRRHPSVVDRNVIAQHAWRDETDPIGSNAIDVHISRLRAKLARSSTHIVTVRGTGYRLETS